MDTILGKFLSNSAILHSINAHERPHPFDMFDLRPVPYHMPCRSSLLAHVLSLSRWMKNYGAATVPSGRGFYFIGCTGSGKSTALMDIAAGIALTFSKAVPFSVIPIYFPSPLFAEVTNPDNPFRSPPHFIPHDSDPTILPVPPALAIIHALESIGISVGASGTQLPQCLRWSEEAFTHSSDAMIKLSLLLRSRKITVLCVVDEFTELFRLSEQHKTKCAQCYRAIASCWVPNREPPAMAFVLSGSTPALHDMLSGRLDEATAQKLGFSSFTRCAPVHTDHVHAMQIARMHKLPDFLWMLKYALHPQSPSAAFNQVLRHWKKIAPKTNMVLPYPPYGCKPNEYNDLLTQTLTITGTLRTTLPQLFLATWGSPRALASLCAVSRGNASEVPTQDDSHVVPSGAVSDPNGTETAADLKDPLTMHDDPNAVARKRKRKRADLKKGTTRVVEGECTHGVAGALVVGMSMPRNADWATLQAMASLLLQQVPTAIASLTRDPFASAATQHRFRFEQVEAKFALAQEYGTHGFLRFPERLNLLSLYSMAESGYIGLSVETSELWFAHPAVAYHALTLLYTSAGGVSSNIQRAMALPDGDSARRYGELLVAGTLGLEHPQGYGSVLGYLMDQHAHCGPKLPDEARGALQRVSRGVSLTWRKPAPQNRQATDMLGACPEDLWVAQLTHVSAFRDVSKNTLYTVKPGTGIDHLCVLEDEITRVYFICTVQDRLFNGDRITEYDPGTDLAIRFTRPHDRWKLTNHLVKQLNLEAEKVVQVRVRVTNTDVTATKGKLQETSIDIDPSRWETAAAATRAAKAARATDKKQANDRPQVAAKAQAAGRVQATANPEAGEEGSQAKITNTPARYLECLEVLMRNSPGITPANGASVVAGHSVMESLWAPPIRLAAHTWNLMAFGGVIHDPVALSKLVKNVGSVAASTSVLLDPSALAASEIETLRKRKKERRSREEEQRHGEVEKHIQEIVHKNRESLKGLLPAQLARFAGPLAAAGLSADDLHRLSVPDLEKLLDEQPGKRAAVLWFERWKEAMR